MIPPQLRESMGLPALEHQLSLLFTIDTYPVVLRTNLSEVRRIASTVRDRLSHDTWRILNQLQQDFHLRHGRIQLDDVLVHLNRMITDLAAFSGMEMESMTRPRVVVPRYRPPHRAFARGDEARAERPRRPPVAHRDARTHARSCRQLDDVPSALLCRGATGTGAGSGHGRRHQPARAGVSARGHGRSRRTAAASSEGAVADARRTNDRARDRGTCPPTSTLSVSRGPTRRSIGSPIRLISSMRTCEACPTPSPFITSAMQNSASAEVTVTYEVVHTTRYTYSEAVSVSHHVARVKPRVRRAGVSAPRAANRACAGRHALASGLLRQRRHILHRRGRPQDADVRAVSTVKVGGRSCSLCAHAAGGGVT